MAKAANGANGKRRVSAGGKARHIEEEARSFDETARQAALVRVISARTQGAQNWATRRGDDVRARPVTGISAAFGAGLIIGLLLGR